MPEEREREIWEENLAIKPLAGRRERETAMFGEGLETAAERERIPITPYRKGKPITSHRDGTNENGFKTLVVSVTISRSHIDNIPFQVYESINLQVLINTKCTCAPSFSGPMHSNEMSNANGSVNRAVGDCTSTFVTLIISQTSGNC